MKKLIRFAGALLAASLAFMSCEVTGPSDIQFTYEDYQLNDVSKIKAAGGTPVIVTPKYIFSVMPSNSSRAINYAGTEDVTTSYDITEDETGEFYSIKTENNSPVSLIVYDDVTLGIDASGIATFRLEHPLNAAKVALIEKDGFDVVDKGVEDNLFVYEITKVQTIKARFSATDDGTLDKTLNMVPKVIESTEYGFNFGMDDIEAETKEGTGKGITILEDSDPETTKTEPVVDEPKSEEPAVDVEEETPVVEDEEKPAVEPLVFTKDMIIEESDSRILLPVLEGYRYISADGKELLPSAKNGVTLDTISISAGYNTNTKTVSLRSLTTIDGVLTEVAVIEPFTIVDEEGNALYKITLTPGTYGYGDNTVGRILDYSVVKL